MKQIILAVAVVALVNGQDVYFREPEKIKSEEKTFGDKLGTYSVSYETEGGILQREIGARKYEGTPDETQLIQGSVQYNAPDGTPISFSWTADEFGTQVHGTHIPTSPPVPEAIQRALEWIAKQPSTEGPDYNREGKSRLTETKQNQFKQNNDNDSKLRG